MERAPKNTGSYIHTLTKEQLSDYYDKQIAFWESVNDKYPRPQNRAQLSRMRNLKREHQNK